MGIAGALPVNEFSILDVVVSKYIYDLTRSAIRVDGEMEFDSDGGSLDRLAQTSVAEIPSRLPDMEGWNSDENVGLKRPNIEFDEELIPDEVIDRHFVRKVQNSLKAALTRGQSIVSVEAKFASGNFLVKDPHYMLRLRAYARKAEVVEMEAAGVYKATHGKRVPFFSIRGISDIVGYERKGNLNDYAAKIAAAFTKAYLETGPFEQKQA